MQAVRHRARLAAARSKGSSALSSVSRPDEEHADSDFEDPACKRLRQYATNVRRVPRSQGVIPLPIHHWKIGEDAEDTAWRDPDTQRDEDQSASQRKKRQDAMSKKASQRRAMSVLSQPSDVPSSPTSQRLPEVYFGSQPRSRAHSPETVDPQPMSQVVAGPFGSRQTIQVSRTRIPKVKKSWGFR